jgi:hypothetical protein
MGLAAVEATVEFSSTGNFRSIKLEALLVSIHVFVYLRHGGR